MAKIKVTQKGKGFGLGIIGSELKKRRDLFVNPIGAKIVIPTGGSDPTTNALEWVLWQEFGTATKVSSAPEFGISGTSEEYNIPGDSNLNPPNYMWFPIWKGRTYGFRKIRGHLLTPKGFIITHPGYRPKKFIRTALKTVREQLRIGIANAVAKGISGDSDFIAIEDATIKELQKVKSAIVAQMREVFGPTKRKDGRLEGKHPATIFRNAAQVVDLSAQADIKVTGKSNIKSRPRDARGRFVKPKIVKDKLFSFVEKSKATRKLRKLTPKDKGFAKAPLSRVDLRFRNPLISRIGRFR